jgi:thymidylate synthase (FAD)
MVVHLLEYTPTPEFTVAMAARLCYSQVGVKDLKEKMSEKEITKLLDKLRTSGHLSPFEHASFTFGVEGISRAATHQLVRHRIASYSQQSQRFVNLEDFHYITPPSISANPLLLEKFTQGIEALREVYKQLLKSDVPKEDARYILPNACETKIVITMNARELLHFFRLRCCNRAQWEIRSLADEMLRRVREVARNLFKEAGPPCLSTGCQEGELSCGRPRIELREKGDD